MIDPAGKRQMSAMEELQAIARSHGSDWTPADDMRAALRGHYANDPDWRAWEREIDTPTIRAALEYMEGEGA